MLQKGGVTMLKLRGFYKSGIIVDQEYPDADDYTESYMNDLYLKFVTMLLDNPIEENDVLLRVEWIQGHVEKAVK